MLTHENKVIYGKCYIMAMNCTDVRELTGIQEIPYLKGGAVLVPSVNIEAADELLAEGY